MKILAHGLTDVGRKRDSNEDAFLIDQKQNIYIVADGMGGHFGGAEASHIAVETVSQYLQETFTSNPSENIKKAVSLANAAIIQKSQEDKKLTGMGTTASVLAFCGDFAYIAHVGDSRIYLFRDDLLWQITEDHSLLYEHKKSGIPLPSQTTLKNALTRSVGFLSNLQSDCFQRKLEKNDVYLLCTDGLTRMLTDKMICHVLKDTPLSKIPRELVRQANDLGGEDNITAVVVGIN